MAADYRFTGTNIDITLVTDAVRGGNTFFVTDKIGEDANEIMAGIDIGIDYHTEAEFRQLAMDNSLTLLRIDSIGLVELVLPGNNAGRFNGLTSQLVYDPVTLASSGTYTLPYEISVTYRLNEDDYLYLRNNGERVLFSTDSTEVANYTASIGFRGTFEMVGLSGQINLGTNFSFFPNINIPTMIDESVNIIFRFKENTELAGSISLQIFVNDNEVFFQQAPFGPPIAVTTPIDEFVFNFGRGLLFGQQRSFFGLLRNIIVSSGGTELINTEDPSTGANSGTGGDGVPTDITQELIT